MTIGPAHFAALSAVVLATGLYGVLGRRNALHALVGLLVMLTAPVIALVGFAHTGGAAATPPMGDALAFVALLAMAALSTVGLSVVMLLWRRTESADLDELRDPQGESAA